MRRLRLSGLLHPRNQTLVHEKSVRNLKDAIRRQTPRKSGKSLYAIIGELNRALGGWFA